MSLALVAAFWAVHWPRVAYPHTLQGLRRRNAPNTVDFTRTATRSHSGAGDVPRLRMTVTSLCVTCGACESAQGQCVV